MQCKINAKNLALPLSRGALCGRYSIVRGYKTASFYIVNNSQVPQITGSAAPFSSKLTLGDAPAILRSWQIGQTLTAEVLAPAQDGVTLLRINGALMSTQTTLPLTPGQTSR